jgi:putative esterase
MRVLVCSTVLLFSIAGCSKAELGAPVLSEGLAACANDGIDGRPHDHQHCVTYRAIAGISMGGGAAMRIALEHPELFDTSISLGSPYIDLEHFFNSISKQANGGFCSREQLLQNLDAIDLKDDPRTWCGPVELKELALPGTTCAGFKGDYNHQYRGPSAGRGGSFSREGSFAVVSDLALAYGNPAFYNPASKFVPPGVGDKYHVPLDLDDDAKAAARTAYYADLCAHPAVLPNFRDRVYNPTGEYPVITFCDGDGPINGEYEPDLERFPVEVPLAVDYNRNGRRDYGEPVIGQPFEPWSDFGADGLPDPMEPGFDPASNPDPSHDDYDWLTNPSGTENNSRFDGGEPFEDLGLDGAAGTGDYGEGNGRFDMNPNLAYAFSRSPRALVERLDARMFSRLHLWVDAGIRDFLYSSQITNHFFGAVMHRFPGAKLYTDWSDLARTVNGEAQSDYDPRLADFSEKTVGRHAYLRYGDPAVCPGVDAATGRGNHVGSPPEVLNRLMTSFAFASARWPKGDHALLSGGISDQESPAQALEDFILVRDFDSAALLRKMTYVVILPPDYYRNPSAHYPVIYFLHGQGQKATDLAASALLLLSPQMGSNDTMRTRARRSDWQKMIIVLADGECHVGECHTGTFYIDLVGPDGNGAKHGQAFFELMRVIDASFRTKPPEMLPE